MRSCHSGASKIRFALLQEKRAQRAQRGSPWLLLSLASSFFSHALTGRRPADAGALPPKLTTRNIKTAPGHGHPDRIPEILKKRPWANQKPGWASPQNPSRSSRPRNPRKLFVLRASHQLPFVATTTHGRCQCHDHLQDSHPHTLAPPPRRREAAR